MFRRSCCAGAARSRGARRLLTSIARVCQALSLPVVVAPEGVESTHLAALLSVIGRN
jgi:EAL domain-containing protein (putative c-di-GMP-specific phosphodiesterase class I)